MRQRGRLSRALEYMGLEEGMAISEIRPDAVFIGSCTNSRIEDLRAAAQVLEGRKVAPSIRKALVVPGSLVKAGQRQRTGSHFYSGRYGVAGAGCSMCLAMNADRLLPGERCAGTSNALRADKAVAAGHWSAQLWRRLQRWRAILCRWKWLALQ